MDMMPVFPIPVGKNELNRPLTHDELNFLQNLPRRGNLLNESSIECHVLRAPQMREINAFIEYSVAEYFKAVHDPKDNVNPYIALSWANYTAKGQMHHTHTHSNSFISGVFYPAAHHTDSIIFSNMKYVQIQVQPKNFNMWNSPTQKFYINAGDVFLFPSDLPHYVEEVQHDGTRISIAFNVFLKGTLGFAEGLNQLTL
jgi:uncharacterized protein (TIGR02466 family)